MSIVIQDSRYKHSASRWLLFTPASVDIQTNTRENCSCYKHCASRWPMFTQVSVDIWGQTQVILKSYFNKDNNLIQDMTSSSIAYFKT